ncbi:chorismate mutase [Streptococcus uberis]|uniref:chorismate mutase n=1 Tax=Streptococcus uberis TaxID=1349 RepID=UPI000AD5BCF1|nr:chorismate mutase type II protein [Streptococcus uberis]
MLDLVKIRTEIDKIDQELVQLLEKRLELVSLVADYKKNNKLDVLDRNREEVVLEKVASTVKNKKLENAIKLTYQGIMASSRHYQKERLKKHDEHQ